MRKFLILFFILLILYIIDRYENIFNNIEKFIDIDMIDKMQDESNTNEIKVNDSKCLINDNNIPEPNNTIKTTVEHSADNFNVTDIDPEFNSTKEYTETSTLSGKNNTYIEPPKEPIQAPYGYVYLSDQYWKIPHRHLYENVQNKNCPLYAMPTVGVPLNSIEYQKGIGTILPDFAFKTL